MSSLSQSPPAVLHVDLDGAPHIFGVQGWEYTASDDPIFATGMRGLLDFLEANRVRATLFTIASDLDNPAKIDLLREAARRGHEIASHTVTHPNLRSLDRDGKSREIRESRERLEQELDTSVIGFRAPSYTIDREGLELLAEAGYRYDSSVYPNHEFCERLGVSSIDQSPHRPLDGQALLELPLPNYRPAPFPFHPSYSLILGRPYFRYGIRRFRNHGHPLVFLFHLTDFAEPMEKDRLVGLKSRVFTLSHLSARAKAKRCQRMLDRIRQLYRIIDTTELLSES